MLHVKDVNDSGGNARAASLICFVDRHLLRSLASLEEIEGATNVKDATNEALENWLCGTFR